MAITGFLVVTPCSLVLGYVCHCFGGAHYLYVQGLSDTSTLQMKKIRSSNKSVTTYMSILIHNPGDHTVDARLKVYEYTAHREKVWN
jgi:hypothetical protein